MKSDNRADALLALLAWTRRVFEALRQDRRDDAMTPAESDLTIPLAAFDRCDACGIELREEGNEFLIEFTRRRRGRLVGAGKPWRLCEGCWIKNLRDFQLGRLRTSDRGRGQP